MLITSSFMIVATIAALAISVVTWDTELGSCEMEGREMARDLRKRKSILEKRLLDLQGAKEEYRLMIRLRRRLSEKCSEVESLERVVRELWSQRDVLEDEQRRSVDGAEELRFATGVISGLREKIDSRKKEMKAVGERVDVVMRNDVKHDTTGMGIGDEEKDGARYVEMEVLELRRTNKELELERRELAFRLDAARARIAGLLSRIENERETVAESKKEAGMLRRANEDLLKRVEQLQKQRFGMVEELVYMRWLNICLRFEAEDFYETARKNSADSPRCDSRREWSAEYVNKTRRILSAVSLGSDSSPPSTESSELSSAAESSSSSSEKRYTLLHRIKHLGRGKKNRNGDPRLLSSDENTTEGGRRIRRYSTSMILESPDTEKRLSRLRRVSFNDAVRNSEPLFENISESDVGSPSTEANEPERQEISCGDERCSSSNREEISGHDHDHEREVADLGTVHVASGAKIHETCIAAFFLVLVLTITLYYRMF